MAPRDPSSNVEPNFEGTEWNLTRGALIAQGSSEEEALAALQKAWRDQHLANLEIWNEHVRLHPPNQEQEGQTRQEQQNLDTSAPATVIPHPPSDDEFDWTSRPTPVFLDIRPARHALKRLEKREFIELWHFTAQGCQDAAQLDFANLEDTFSIVNTDKGFVFQPIGASSVSSKVIKDEH